MITAKENEGLVRIPTAEEVQVVVSSLMEIALVAQMDLLEKTFKCVEI